MGLAMSRRRSACACPSRLPRNGFTPAYDPRRYLGVGPRMGFEGNKALPSSWVVEWHVGAAVLFSDRTFDSNGGVANSVLPNYASSGSVVNVDGLLGLSYWFDTASKLTLSYRADYFKGSPAWNLTGAARTTPTASVTGR